MNCSYCGGFLTDEPGRRRPCTAWWLALGERLEDATRDSYKDVQYLGHGGMGAVFKGTHRVFRSVHALKALAPDPEGLHRATPELRYPDLGLVERFKTEATVMHNMVHSNIVRVHEIATKPHIHYFSMDFVDGPSLSGLLGRLGPDEFLDLAVIRIILRDVGTALDYAHRQAIPIIHRDIKPGNVLIRTDGQALVSDFGIASVQSGTAHTGSIVGTPLYMSPEAWRADKPSPQSDQYSFGIVAYEMLTGQLPFRGTLDELHEAHRAGAPRSIRELRPDCPPEVEAAVLRMMAKRPAERWETLTEALQALDALEFIGMQAARGRLSELTKKREPKPAAPETFEVVIRSDRTPELRSGEHLALSAVMVKRSASETSQSDPGFVGWYSSDPEIAEVDDKGRVTAHRPGTATIHARILGASAKLAVRVLEAAPASIRIQGLPEGPLTVGQTIRLTAEVTAGAGSQATVVLRWMSSDPAVASISDHGVVTATGPGTATISAHAVGTSSEARIAVGRLPAQFLEIADPGPMVAGRSYSFGASARDGRGVPVPDAVVSWSSSDPGVGTIDSAGVFQAGRAGAVRIMAWAESATASLDVVIGEAQPARVVGQWPKGPFKVGRTARASAQVLDDQGNPLAVGVRWLSSNPAVAQVDEAGTIRLLAAGSAAITASAGSLSDTSWVQVVVPAPMPPWVRWVAAAGAGVAVLTGLWFGGLAGQRLRVEPARASIQPGQSVTLRTRINWFGVAPVPVKPQVVRRGTGAIEVGAAGRLRGVAAGVDTLFAIRGKDTAMVIVEVRSAAALALGADNLDLTVGQEVAVPLTSATDSTGGDARRRVTWTSQNPAIASVIRPGTIRGLAEGTTAVIVRLGRLVDTVTVVVSGGEVVEGPATVARIEIAGARTPMAVGATRGLAVQGRDAAGNRVEVRGVRWSSADPSVLRVEASGRVTALKAGRAEVVAEVAGVAPASLAIEVNAAAATCVAGQLRRLELRARSSRIRVGQTTPLDVAGWDDCGNPVDAVSGAWSVNPASVVAVDRGVARGTAAGTATVTLEASGITASVRIEVERAPAPGGFTDADRQTVAAARDACQAQVSGNDASGVAPGQHQRWLRDMLGRGEARPRFTLIEKGEPTSASPGAAESSFVLDVEYREAFGGTRRQRLRFVVAHTKADGAWTSVCQLVSRASPP